jgi:chromosome segregation ATPase
MSTFTPRLVYALVLAGFAVNGCDKKEDSAADLEAKKTKSVFDVKQSAKTEMSKEELEEARRKAGFKSHEERLDEAKAEYEKMERGFIKGRLPAYRDLMKGVRAKLDEVEKAAPKWAKAEATFEKWNTKYKEDVKALKKTHDELNEKGSRGGNLEVDIGTLLTDWEAFNAELDPKISEAEGFATSLEGLRTKIGEIEKELDAIEKDDTIEPEEPEGGEKKGDKKEEKKEEKEEDAKEDAKEAKGK